MFIIEIIPLTILFSQASQVLSYFYTESLYKGAVVEVTVNNRKIYGIVVASSTLETEKAALKKSNFQLKKISRIISATPLISENQFKIAFWLSRNYYAPLGICLKTILPPFFLKKNYELRINNYSDNNIKKNALSQHTILLSQTKDVLKNIEPLVTKTLNQKKQVLIIIPEISAIDSFYKYFADYYQTITIHGKIPLKNSYAYWHKIASGEINIIIGTRLALFYPFKNIGLIIVEDPVNQAYKSDMTPKYNTRDLAVKVSEIYGSKLVFSELALSVSDYLCLENKECEVKNMLNQPRPDVKIVDMISEMRSGNFSVISRTLANEIRRYVADKKMILLFSARKGFSGSLICDHCGFTFKCSQCSIPLRLHKAKIGGSNLLCHRCYSSPKYPRGCPNCQSYKLKPRGIPGNQKIIEGLEKLFEYDKIKPYIFALESAVVDKSSKAKGASSNIESSGSYICVATQTIFSHRYRQKFDLIGLPNVDALTTLPDFKSEEDLIQQFEKLVDFEPDKIIIQTLKPDDQTLTWITHGSYNQFFKTELAVRKLFFYPPFSKLAKITYRHTMRERADYEAKILSEKLKAAILQKKLSENVKILGPSSAFVEKERGYYVYNIILKVSPNQKLSELLGFVSPHWSIDVDPKSIL